ncbi:sugar transferase [Rhodococcus sp. SORGH_AS_0301]|uniref:sugar transferase n=1 Tax=unclassified Rhodococcus (in: high G+C Gram-positive bacteria) TaxID=192944 RepID=UPI00358E21BC
MPFPRVAPSSRAHWQAVYRRRVALTDLAVIVLSVALAHVVRFGENSSLMAASVDIDYVTVSLLLVVGWSAFLVIFGARSTQIIGTGAEEYRRILSATMRLFGVVAILSLLFRIDFARGYLAIALPFGAVGLLIGRHVWRGWARRHKASGLFTTSVLVVGSHRAATSMAASFERDESSGCRVVGACVPGHGVATSSNGAGSLDVDGHRIPVLGDEHAVIAAMHSTGADVIAVTATEHLGAEGMKRLLWELDPFGVDLVVAPGVADIAGPRLTLQPVADLPLLHVQKPRYQGATRFTKTAFDMCFSALALLLVSPVLLAIALAVKIDTRGPIFYKSERMGLDGNPFQMIKFRTMVVDADKHLATLLARNESEGGVLFKMKHDPRVTRVGRVLRRYSLDELPQFVNVLRREMSVVGPRPPLRREVETYDGNVRRRLLVRPGVTGLWQVSGRSDLTWEESVRLDLSYVENWSMTQDMLIIVKTVRAVFGSEGAY